MADTIKEIADHLSRIFRHMLPGVVVVGAARLAHPHWFVDLQLEQASHVAILVGLALATGNVWYVFHRYTVLQFLDFLFYATREKKLTGYPDWLSKFIYDSFDCEKTEPKMRNHIHFRSAQIILIFIVSEVALLFSFWHEDGTFFAGHKCALLTIGGLGFVSATIQCFVGDILDRETIRQHQQNKKSS